MKKLDEILDMCPNFYDRESFANGYLKGYHQAEKDLELSWHDIVMIDKLLIDLGMMFPCKSTPDYYQEVLKRFNEQRNEDKNVGTLNI